MKDGKSLVSHLENHSFVIVIRLSNKSIKVNVTLQCKKHLNAAIMDGLHGNISIIKTFQKVN